MSKTLTWQTVRGNGLFSEVIGYFGAGWYSHIDVLTPTGMLRGARSDVIQGVKPGYMDRPYNYEKWETQTQWTVEVSDAQSDAYWKFSNAQLGKPYDTRQLFDDFGLGRNWRDDNAWWCSEEVARNMEVAGIWTIPARMLNVEPGHCVWAFIGMHAAVTEFKDWKAL